jgi:hypothetical protein
MIDYIFLGLYPLGKKIKTSMVLGLQIRVLCLLSKCSTTWAISQFCFVCFLSRVLYFLPRAGLGLWSPWLDSPGNRDYRPVPSYLACFWNKVLLTFSWAGFELQSSYLCLLNSWDYRHAALYPTCNLFIFKSKNYLECWLLTTVIVIRCQN